MSGATERPAEQIQTAPATPAGPAAAGLPPAEVYRSLSVLAVIGFLAALAYTAVMAVLATVALVTRSPLLVAPVWFLLPLAAIVLCRAGRKRIRDAEGTLGGDRLATWGVTLSLLSALLYGSYYMATFFALRQQASDYAERWMEELKRGNVERAYWMRIPPSTRPADTNPAQLREGLELRYNTEQTQGYTLSNFRSADLVTLLGGAGERARLRLAGVLRWGYDDPTQRGSYFVVLRYRLETPDLEADVDVPLFGSEAPGGEYQGRQWYVQAEKCHVVPGSVRWTPEGERHKAAAEAARTVVEAWPQKLLERDRGYSLVSGVKEPPDGWRPFAVPALVGTAAAGAADAKTRDYALYRDGSLVRPNLGTYWAIPAQRQQILEALSRVFAPGHDGSPDRRTLRVIPALLAKTLPPVEVKDGRARVTFDTALVVNTHTRGMPDPEWAVDAHLVLEGPLDSNDFRVVAIEPVSGRKAPASGDPRIRARVAPPMGGP
jgi:hypothetical protein